MGESIDLATGLPIRLLPALDSVREQGMPVTAEVPGGAKALRELFRFGAVRRITYGRRNEPGFYYRWAVTEPGAVPTPAALAARFLGPHVETTSELFRAVKKGVELERERWEAATPPPLLKRIRDPVRRARWQARENERAYWLRVLGQ